MNLVRTLVHVRSVTPVLQVGSELSIAEKSGDGGSHRGIEAIEGGGVLDRTRKGRVFYEALCRRPKGVADHALVILDAVVGVALCACPWLLRETGGVEVCQLELTWPPTQVLGDDLGHVGFHQLPGQIQVEVYVQLVFAMLDAMRDANARLHQIQPFGQGVAGVDDPGRVRLVAHDGNALGAICIGRHLIAFCPLAHSTPLA